jgi:hypothetical protein
MLTIGGERMAKVSTSRWWALVTFVVLLALLALAVYVNK